MQRLVYVTGNTNKFTAAQHFCTQKGIEIGQLVLDIDEIQGENGELIALDKAKRAYEQSKRPLVVSDHCWSIPGLNGFPGAYMKSVTHWFTVQNFIDLTKNLDDRRTILTEYLVYTDGTDTKVFTHERYGEILREPRGSSPVSWEQIVVMNESEGLTIAETFEQNRMPDAQEAWRAWDDFAAWYTAR